MFDIQHWKVILQELCRDLIYIYSRPIFDWTWVWPHVETNCSCVWLFWRTLLSSAYQRRGAEICCIGYVFDHVLLFLKLFWISTQNTLRNLSKKNTDDTVHTQFCANQKGAGIDNRNGWFRVIWDVDCAEVTAAQLSCVCICFVSNCTSAVFR